MGEVIRKTQRGQNHIAYMILTLVRIGLDDGELVPLLPDHFRNGDSFAVARTEFYEGHR